MAPQRARRRGRRQDDVVRRERGGPRLRQGAGRTEAIFANTAGLLCEGTGSNVFVGIGGRLLTPPLSSGCLAGVTRDLVLEVTDAVEEDIPMAAFLAADEVFLTSTGRDVQPVHQRRRPPRSPSPAPSPRAAARAFRALVATTDDP